jgi:hypothetical protein
VMEDPPMTVESSVINEPNVMEVQASFTPFIRAICPRSTISFFGIQTSMELWWLWMKYALNSYSKTRVEFQSLFVSFILFCAQKLLEPTYWYRWCGEPLPTSREVLSAPP